MHLPYDYMDTVLLCFIHEGEIAGMMRILPASSPIFTRTAGLIFQYILPLAYSKISCQFIAYSPKCD